MEDVVFLLVVGARFVVPLFIPRFPLPAIICCLVLDAADDAGVELPLAREMKDHLRAAIEAGYGDDDFIALFLHLRRASGLDAAAGSPR